MPGMIPLDLLVALTPAALWLFLELAEGVRR
jgi:hypothetical protein